MITNFETDKVYFAHGLTLPKYANASCNLMEALHKNNVSFEMLPFTESSLHIWARDYMPIQVRKGKIVRFRYEPDYLQNYPEYKPDTTDIIKNLGINVTYSDIVLDGGNVISCGSKIIMTDKIFKENPRYSKTSLLDKLSEMLEAEPVIIPWDRYEEYGHSDGMVRYMGEGRVLLNNYIDFGKSLRKRLLDALEPHFEVTELHYGSYTKYSWAYLNFLHVGKCIFVPLINDRLEEIALEQISITYQECNCIQVPGCESIVKEGGALNCTTWNVQKLL